MTKHMTKTIVGLVALGTLLAAPARGADGKSYFGVDVGLTLNSSTQLEQIANTQVDETIKFKNGYRFGLTGGYMINDNFAVEGETGLSGTSVSSIGNGLTLVGDDLSIYQIPLLVNVIWRIPTGMKLKPYVGLGAGMAVSYLHTQGTTIAGVVTLTGTDATVVPALQALAGIRYDFTDRLGLVAGYKYFYSGSPDWNTLTQIKVGALKSHQINVGLNFTF
jgi:outer membrane protein W